ncbi:trehalose-phosphatase [Psychrobacter sp. P11G5]|uniref:trehalose-phosphatase n=1 Tax=Psychrobacter sp. P11G5 TaxID=1699624 RepID=UPI0009EF21B7|nr:trehalose-phosphatase [Psychrobacter sp. P11G5]
MTSGRNHSLNTPAIYIQPNNFANYLSHQRDYCLFLDIDGTLADFTLDPKDSIIPNATLLLLQRIQNYGVQVAIVTGRSLAEAKQMLSPLQLPIAATHGLEIALNGSFNSAIGKKNDNNVASTAHVDNAELTAIRQIISQYSTSYSDLTIENKPYSVALHFRKNPTLANVAHTIMLKTLSNYANWTLKQGKYVWEIVPKGADKGTAILTLLEKMQTDKELCAIFIGDDITDEAGFIAVQNENTVFENEVSKNKVSEKRAIQKYRSSANSSVNSSVKGMGIKVGSEPTCAHYYVRNIDEVTVLLDNFLSFCQFVFYQKNATLSSDLADSNLPLLKEQRDKSYEPINRLI